MGPLMVIHYTNSAESDGKKKLKIAQHLPKLWAIKQVVIFYETRCILCRARGDTYEHRQTKQKKNKHQHSLPPGLCGGNLLTTLRCLQRGLSSQSLGKYWQLNQSNQHMI